MTRIGIGKVAAGARTEEGFDAASRCVGCFVALPLDRIENQLLSTVTINGTRLKLSNAVIAIVVGNARLGVRIEAVAG